MTRASKKKKKPGELMKKRKHKQATQKKSIMDLRPGREEWIRRRDS